MRKRKSTRFKVSDGIIVFLCLCVAVSSSVFFIKDLYAAQTKQNEEPIAVITFKQRSAQRKFMDRVIWDRVQQNAPIYNGDILRTAPLSEATIYFSDGNIIDMYENTMVQVFYNETGAEVSMSGSSSNITITTENSKKGLSFTSDQGTRVDIDSGSVLSAKNTEQALAVQVKTGTAQVTGSKGDIFTAQAGKALELTTSGQVIEKPITVLSPLSNDRILNYTKNSIPVLFSWKKTPALETDTVILEIAQDKSFNTILWSIETREFSAEVQLETGSYYWRFVSKKTPEDTATTVLESSKLTLLSCPPPVPIVPSSGVAYSYRNKEPVIRFLWDGNNYASAYELEIADNPEMSKPIIKQRVANNSGSTADLGEGNWYWRVTPYYTINNTGFAEPSEVTHFVITKISDLEAPVPTFPIEDTLFRYGTKQREPTIATFSWKVQPDASYYTLLIADNNNMENPIIEKVTSENFYALPIDLETLPEGDWYWSLYQTDFETNTSPLSPPRRFSIIQGADGELKTLYPPNNYSALSAYTNKILFAWKTTGTMSEMHFQTSSAPDFSPLEINTPVSENTLTNMTLSPGNWYWRISGYDGYQEIFSDSRQVTILSPNEGPELLSPVPNSTTVISDTTPITISWKEIPTADYYNVSLTADNKKYSFTNVKNTSITTLLPATEDSLVVEGTIQAFSNETDFSTALYSQISYFSFTVRNKLPVEVIPPVRKESLPPLKGPVLVSPAKKQVFDSDYLRNNQTLTFSWKPVTGATEYIFTLYKKGKLNKEIQILKTTLPKTTTEYILKDMSILDVGTFVWKVEQNGITSSSDFTIEIPIPKAPVFKFKPTGKLYGN